MDFLREISDFIFPPRCLGCSKRGSLLCDNCLSHLPRLEINYCPFCSRISNFGATCSHCRKNHYLDGAIVAFFYQGLVRDLILKAKYKPYLYPLFKRLALPLARRIKTSPLYEEYFLKENFTLIPIPLTIRKKAQRGFNQSEIIGETLSLECNLPLNSKILYKVKDTPSQSRLNLLERKENIKNSFQVDASLAKGNFILVDDLLTSGSTANEAARVLKQAGAHKVWAFVLARNLRNKKIPTPIKSRETN